MKSSHVVGGGSAAALGAVAASLINHFAHDSVSDADALLIGGAVLSAGVGLGHVIGEVGLLGLFRRFLRGGDHSPAVEPLRPPGSVS